MTAEGGEGKPRAAGDAEALARYRAAARRRRSDPAVQVAPGLSVRRRVRRSVQGTPSGPGPDARDPQRVSAVWRGLADIAGWTNEMAVWSLTNRWPEMVGPQVAEHVRVVAFDPRPQTPQVAPGQPSAVSSRRAPRTHQESLLPETLSTTGPREPRQGGKLILEADSNSWQQQMVWNLVHLQRRLDEELGGGVVGSIVVFAPTQRRRGYSPRSP